VRKTCEAGRRRRRRRRRHRRELYFHAAAIIERAHRTRRIPSHCPDCSAPFARRRSKQRLRILSSFCARQRHNAPRHPEDLVRPYDSSQILRVLERDRSRKSRAEDSQIRTFRYFDPRRSFSQIDGDNPFAPDSNPLAPRPRAAMLAIQRAGEIKSPSSRSRRRSSAFDSMISRDSVLSLSLSLPPFVSARVKYLASLPRSVARNSPALSRIARGRRGEGSFEFNAKVSSLTSRCDVSARRVDRVNCFQKRRSYANTLRVPDAAGPGREREGEVTGSAELAVSAAASVAQLPLECPGTPGGS